jgi:hypothetical protein
VKRRDFITTGRAPMWVDRVSSVGDEAPTLLARADEVIE